jgi:hypothetical protein
VVVYCKVPIKINVRTMNMIMVRVLYFHIDSRGYNIQRKIRFIQKFHMSKCFYTLSNLFPSTAGETHKCLKIWFCNLNMCYSYFIIMHFVHTICTVIIQHGRVTINF